MGRLVALFVAAALVILGWLSCHRDAGRRALTLFIDPTMSRADAYGAGITNVGNFGGSHQPFQVEVKRLGDHSTLITLSRAGEQYTYQIDFWFTLAGDGAPRVEGMAGTYDGDRQPIWPVYDLEGTVRLSRDDPRPAGDKALLLAFELDGTHAGSNAPQKGYFEIPPSALR